MTSINPLVIQGLVGLAVVGGGTAAAVILLNKKTTTPPLSTTVSPADPVLPPQNPATTDSDNGFPWAIFLSVVGGLILLVALLYFLNKRRLKSGEEKGKHKKEGLAAWIDNDTRNVETKIKDVTTQLEKKAKTQLGKQTEAVTREVKGAINTKKA